MMENTLVPGTRPFCLDMVPLRDFGPFLILFCFMKSQVQPIDNVINKKEMTIHCYRIAYRSMEHLTDDVIYDLQVNITSNKLVQL